MDEVNCDVKPVEQDKANDQLRSRIDPAKKNGAESESNRSWETDQDHEYSSDNELTDENSSYHSDDSDEDDLVDRVENCSLNGADSSSSENSENKAADALLESMEKPKKSKEKKKREKKKDNANTKKELNQKKGRWMKYKVPRVLYFTHFQIFETNPAILQDNLLSSQTTYIDQYENKIYCLVCHNCVKNDLQKIYEHWRSRNHLAELKALQSRIYWRNIPSLDKTEINLHVNFIERKGDTFDCVACNEVIQKNQKAEILDRRLYEKHVLSPRHIMERSIVQRRCNKLHNSILWCHTSSFFTIDIYYCSFCKVRFHSEGCFASHLEGVKHKSIMKNLKDKAVIFDGCTNCGWLWIGTKNLYYGHCETYHAKLSSALFDMPKKLNQFIVDSLNKKDMFPSQLNDRGDINAILQSLEAIVNPQFPEAKAYAFGSRESGLALQNSDIDVFMDCGNYYETGLELSTLISNMKKVWLLISKCKTWEMIRKIEQSRTPILTVKHKKTNISCDISFGNGLSVENSRLIRNYIQSFPLLRQMILFTKEWLKVCDLHGSQKITSYAISWFVIFYLQSMQILPSVAELIQWKNKSKIVNGWETGVIDQIPPIKCDLSFRELITGMFVFYAEFNFLFDLACPLTGSIIPKTTFTEIDELPSCMFTYKKYIDTSEEPEYFRIDSAMCIQDPFDLSHNLTKGVKKLDIFRFQFLSMKTVELLIEH